MNLETSSPRRDFLRATALAGGGLVIGFLVPGARRFAMAQEATAAAPTTFVPSAWQRSISASISSCVMCEPEKNAYVTYGQTRAR